MDIEGDLLAHDDKDDLIGAYGTNSLLMGIQ